jgi:Ankyrin repeat
VLRRQRNPHAAPAPATQKIRPMNHRLAALAATSTLVLAACGAGDADPAQALAKLGYKPERESACRAAGKGDVAALKLMAQAGQATRSLVIDGDRFCLESALAGRAGKIDVAAVMSEVKPDAAELNRAYASAIGMTARDVPQADTLTRAAGHRGENFYAGGKVVEATPLMLAVWAGNAAAVQSLLEHGADPNVPSRIPVQVQSGHSAAGAQAVSSGSLMQISTTPLFEAHRLQQPQIVKLLSQRGAKALISSRT